MSEIVFIHGTASIDNVPADGDVALSFGGSSLDIYLPLPENVFLGLERLTFQSIQFELQLPNNGAEVLSGEMALFALQSHRHAGWNPFRIGNQVPDSGSTVGLMSLGLLVLLLFERFFLPIRARARGCCDYSS